jgi:hypothetical protein
MSVLFDRWHTIRLWLDTPRRSLDSTDSTAQESKVHAPQQLRQLRIVELRGASARIGNDREHLKGMNQQSSVYINITKENGHIIEFNQSTWVLNIIYSNQQQSGYNGM